jgi:hypothetical protein
MDAIVVLCPDLIELEDEEDWVEAKAMIRSKERDRKCEKKRRKRGEFPHLWSRALIPR